MKFNSKLFAELPRVLYFLKFKIRIPRRAIKMKLMIVFGDLFKYFLILLSFGLFYSYLSSAYYLPYMRRKQLWKFPFWNSWQRTTNSQFTNTLKLNTENTENTFYNLYTFFYNFKGFICDILQIYKLRKNILLKIICI